MKIANPIYDTVFKYLMEDIDIAKGILSLILETEILELNIKPQETVAERQSDDKLPISVYRLDFVAVFRDERNEIKKALIELQKTRRSTSITRFRGYLAENYQKEDTVVENGVEIKKPLEIITIYFLGFPLEDIKVPILKVKNCFIDVVNNKKLVTEPHDKFIRLLNHESYTIQIPYLEPNDKSRVEKVLNVFSQKYRTENQQILEYNDTINDPLLESIVNRLTRAIVNDEIRKKMKVEEEIETEFQELDKKLADQNKLIIQQTQELEQKDQELEQKDQELEQKDQVLAQKNQELLEQTRLIEMLKKELEKKNK